MRQERGASFVELSLVTLSVVFVLLVLIDLTRYFGTQAILDKSARNGMFEAMLLPEVSADAATYTSAKPGIIYEAKQFAVSTFLSENCSSCYQNLQSAEFFRPTEAGYPIATPGGSTVEDLLADFPIVLQMRASVRLMTLPSVTLNVESEVLGFYEGFYRSERTARSGSFPETYP